MAFTYDITTTRGMVRFAVGDTSAAHPIFTDAEIDYAIDEGVTVDAACAILLKTLKAAAAIRGDAARVGAIDETIAALHDMPTVTVVEPALLPMDSGWEYGDN